MTEYVKGKKMASELEGRPSNGPFEATVNSKFSLISTGSNECQLVIQGTIKYLESVNSIVKCRISYRVKKRIKTFYKMNSLFFKAVYEKICYSEMKSSYKSFGN